MKKYVLLLGLILSGCLNEPYPYIQENVKQQNTIKKMYVFGDSLSDQGSLFGSFNGVLNTNLHIMTPPSSNAGWAISNGKLLVEKVALYYGVKLSPIFNPARKGRIPNNSDGLNTLYDVFKYGSVSDSTFKSIQNNDFDISANNFSFAGAAIEYPNKKALSVYRHLTLPKQVDLYLERFSDKNYEQILYIMIAGANDVLELLENDDITLEEANLSMDKVLDTLLYSIEKIRSRGAKKIVISSIPNLGNTPEFYGKDRQKIAEDTVLSYNKKLKEAITTRYKENSVLYVDINIPINELMSQYPADIRHKACLKDFLDNYTLVTFNNVLTATLEGKYINGCSLERLKNKEFLFYNTIHPTDVLNSYVAKYVINAIDTKLLPR